MRLGRRRPAREAIDELLVDRRRLVQLGAIVVAGAQIVRGDGQLVQGGRQKRVVREVLLEILQDLDHLALAGAQTQRVRQLEFQRGQDVGGRALEERLAKQVDCPVVVAGTLRRQTRLIQEVGGARVVRKARDRLFQQADRLQRLAGQNLRPGLPLQRRHDLRRRGAERACLLELNGRFGPLSLRQQAVAAHQVVGNRAAEPLRQRRRSRPDRGQGEDRRDTCAAKDPANHGAVL